MHLPIIELHILVYALAHDADLVKRVFERLTSTLSSQENWDVMFHLTSDIHELSGALGIEDDAALEVSIPSGKSSISSQIASRDHWDLVVYTCHDEPAWQQFATVHASQPQSKFLVIHNPDKIAVEEIIAYDRCDYLTLPIVATVLEHRLNQMIHQIYDVMSSTQYDGIIKNSVDPIVMLDSTGKIVMWNDAATELYGWTEKDVVQRPYFEVVTPDMGAERFEAILRQADVHGRWHDEVIHYNREGMELYISSLIDVVLNPPNRMFSYLAVNRDISVQRAVEETLKNYQKRIESVLDVMPEIVIILDDDGRYIDIITSHHPGLIAPATELLGNTVHDYFSDEVATQFVNHIRSAIINNRNETLDYDIILDDNQLKFHAIFCPLDAHHVVMVASDITMLKSTEEALSEASQRYEALFRFANDAIFLIDLESGNILEANRQATRLLGFTIDELKGKNITDIEANGDELATSEEFSISVQTSDRIILEQYYRHKDGEVVPVETSNRIIVQDDKRIIISFVRDIRQRKDALRAERAQRVLAETLRDTATAISRTLDVDQLLDLIVDNASRLINNRPVNVMLIDDKMARIVRHRGYDRYIADEQLTSLRFDVDRALSIQQVMKSRTPNSIPDVRAQKNWTHMKGLEWIRSQVSIPIIIKNEVIGIINMDSNVVNDFDSYDRDRIQALSEQASIAFQNARLLARTRQHAKELEEAVEMRTRALSNANNALKQQIVERQKVEEELEQERNLLKTLIDSIPDWIYVHDRSGNFMVINDAMRKVLGIDGLMDVIGGATESTTLNTNALDAVAYFDKSIFESEQPILNESRTYVNMDGDEERYLVSKFPLHNNQGEITGIVGINRNITSLYRTQEQLEQVLNSARCLLWSAIVEEVDGQYQWQLVVNNEDAAQKLVPLDIGQRTYSEVWLDSILLEDYQRRQYLFRTNIQQNRLTYNQEFRCRRADGELVWLIEDVQAKQLADGRWNLVGVCTDISDLKLAESALQQANNELEKRVRQRTEELTRANNILSDEILERQRAEEAERQQRILAEALRDSGALIIDNLDYDRVLDYLLDSLIDVIPHDAANISILDDGWMSVAKQRDYPTPIPAEPIDVSDWDDIQEITRTHSYCIINDRNKFGWVGVDGDDWIRSNLTIPILIEDEVIGVLKLESRHANHFNDKQAEWLQAFANQAGIAMRNARLVDEIRSYTEELEGRVRDRTAQLDNERAQLQAILDSMRDGVFYRDKDDNLLYTNKALIDITGYSVEKWRDNSVFDEINTSTDEEYARTLGVVELHLKQVGFWRSDTTIRQQDGQIIDVNLTRTVVKDWRGDRIGVVTVVRDVSQEKALEEQKARFIASASHELRTPIANLKTRLFLMTRRADKFEEHIAVANEVVNWMQRLVEDMFDLSRFERGVIELEFENVNLQKFINDTVIFQQPEAERKLISLFTEMPSEPILFMLDPYRMTQVITNLVTNAIHYTPENGEVRIDVDLDEDNGVIIKVSDNGPGIVPEHLPHLFQPFYRGNMGSKGAGLGLSIAREIVESHGGTIRVESLPEVGSQFTIHLPRKLPEDKQVES